MCDDDYYSNDGCGDGDGDGDGDCTSSDDDVFTRPTAGLPPTQETQSGYDRSSNIKRIGVGGCLATYR